MRINKHSRQNPESQAAKPIRAEVPARKAVLGRAPSNFQAASGKEQAIGVTPADISQVPGHVLLSSVEMGRYVHGHASICEVLASSQGLQQQKDGLKTVAVALWCLRAWILMPNCKPTLIVDFARGNTRAQAVKASTPNRTGKSRDTVGAVRCFGISDCPTLSFSVFMPRVRFTDLNPSLVDTHGRLMNLDIDLG